MNDSRDFYLAVTSLDVSSLPLPVIICVLIGCEVVKANKLLQTAQCKHRN